MNHYVWDVTYIDAPVVRFQDGDGDGTWDDPSDSERYHTFDASRNITAVIDRGTGNVIERYGYDPYGQATVYDSAFANGAAPTVDGLLYAGYFFDAETGLYHVRNRQYDAALGRFIQRDPIGYAAGDSSLYRYVGNSPVNATDPSGLTGEATAPMSKAEWREHVIEEAGLTNDLGADGTGWTGGEPYGWLGLEAARSRLQNRQILARIYVTYARLYSADPDRLLWAGIASHAGSLVVTQGLDRLEREMVDLLSPTSNAMNLLSYPLHYPAIAALALDQALVRDEMSRILTGMGIAIFLDLAWQHEAYIHGGICEIQRLHEAGELDEKMYDAWKNIDSGEPNRVKLGNITFAEVEQLRILKPGYEQIKGLAIEPITIGWRIAQHMSDEASTQIDGQPTFREAYPDGDFTNTNEDPDQNERWQYIKDSGLTPFADLSAEERYKIVKNAVDSVTSREQLERRYTPKPTAPFSF